MRYPKVTGHPTGWAFGREGRPRASIGGISAEVVEDSVSPAGKRLTTFLLKYPRFVHAEFMTHRELSRNAASSRAIPVRKVRSRVLTAPAEPIHWGRNRSGMQADGELRGLRLLVAKLVWRAAGWVASLAVLLLDLLGLHKQVANRLLEPWFTIEVVATATGWGNFFNLRLHPAAQPEMQALAWCMWGALKLSSAQRLKMGQWHLPFVTLDERRRLDSAVLIDCAVARCARTSYLNHDGSAPSYEKDWSLIGKLSEAPHASPFEHVATPSCDPESRSGNFVGWEQYRKYLPREYRPEFAGPPVEILEAAEGCRVCGGESCWARRPWWRRRGCGAG